MASILAPLWPSYGPLYGKFYGLYGPLWPYHALSMCAGTLLLLLLALSMAPMAPLDGKFYGLYGLYDTL